MREHTPQWGISCTPGGQERPKVAPLTYYGEGTAHETARFSYYGKVHRDFSLNITLHHNVIETWGGLIYSGNQSDSQDYCVAVKTTPGNHLEHPSN